MGLDLFEPVFHGVEGGAIIDGISHDDSHGPLVVCLGYGLESLLACCVPYLHAYLFAVNFDGFDFKVDSLLR